MDITNLFRIRDAHDDERATIRDLTLAAYAEYAAIMSPPAWAALQQVLHATLAMEEAVERIVAEQGGALVGSVLLYPPTAKSYGDALAGPGWPEIRLLAVAPAAREHGVGTALIDECIRRAKRSGATALGLHSSESMRAAIRLYARMGFVRTPEYDFYTSGSELIAAYRRDLYPPTRPLHP